MDFRRASRGLLLCRPLISKVLKSLLAILEWLHGRKVLLRDVRLRNFSYIPVGKLLVSDVPWLLDLMFDWTNTRPDRKDIIWMAPEASWWRLAPLALFHHSSPCRPCPRLRY